MANNLQQWQSEWEDNNEDILKEIEQKIVHNAHTLSHFGRVIELFVPNALQTAAHLIAGAKDTGPRRQRGGRYSAPVIPEGRPQPKGGSTEERLLPDTDFF
jgi:hypothetical protein